MKNSSVITAAAAAMLALGAAFNLRHGPSVEASSTESPDAAARLLSTPLERLAANGAGIKG